MESIDDIKIRATTIKDVLKGYSDTAKTKQERMKKASEKVMSVGKGSRKAELAARILSETAGSLGKSCERLKDASEKLNDYVARIGS